MSLEFKFLFSPNLFTLVIDTEFASSEIVGDFLISLTEQSLPWGMPLLLRGCVCSVTCQGLGNKDWYLWRSYTMTCALQREVSSQVHLQPVNACWQIEIPRNIEVSETRIFEWLLTGATFVTIQNNIFLLLFQMQVFLQLLNKSKQINPLGPENKANQMLFPITRLCV